MKRTCFAVLIIGTTGLAAHPACAQATLSPLRLVDSADLKMDLRSGLELSDFQASHAQIAPLVPSKGASALTIPDLLVSEGALGFTQVRHQEHVLFAPSAKGGASARLTLTVTEETDWYTAALDAASSKPRSLDSDRDYSVHGLGLAVAPRLAETRLPALSMSAQPSEARKLRETNYNITYTRGWPGAVSLRGGGVDLDVTPHAGFGIGSKGSSAEAGAVVSLSQTVSENLTAIGIRDGRSYGDQGRWYIFAAASGRAVGYNFTGNLTKLQQSGVSTDTGAYIGDAQAGMGWRKGAMQASFGYVQRKVKSHGIKEEDNFVALTLSIKPSW